MKVSAESGDIFSRFIIEPGFEKFQLALKGEVFYSEISFWGLGAGFLIFGAVAVMISFLSFRCMRKPHSPQVMSPRERKEDLFSGILCVYWNSGLILLQKLSQNCTI